MVGVPLSSYQPTNARYIVEDVWEVGVRARFGKLGVAEREAIKEVLKESDGGGEKGGDVEERKQLEEADSAKH